MYTFLIVAAVLMGLVLMGLRVIQEYERCVVFRLGHFLLSLAQ